MSDLISREAAREHMKKRLYETAINNVGYVTDASEIYEDVADERLDTWINEVPSEEATPDVWIVKHTDICIFTYCSNCGADGKVTWNYCPMCGFPMTGQMRRFADNDTAQGGLRSAT